MKTILLLLLIPAMLEAQTSTDYYNPKIKELRYYKSVKHFTYPDGFGIERTVICNDTGIIKIKGKVRISDTTVTIIKFGVTRVYYLLK